jgi:hypothetical protein
MPGTPWALLNIIYFYLFLWLFLPRVYFFFLGLPRYPAAGGHGPAAAAAAVDVARILQLQIRPTNASRQRPQ